MKRLYILFFVGALLVFFSACRPNGCGCPQAQISTGQPLD